jgi:hypothetical protein
MLERHCPGMPARPMNSTMAKRPGVRAFCRDLAPMACYGQRLAPTKELSRLGAWRPVRRDPAAMAGSACSTVSAAKWSAVSFSASIPTRRNRRSASSTSSAPRRSRCSLSIRYRRCRARRSGIGSPRPIDSIDDPTRQSTVKFVQPYDEVVAGWCRVIAAAYRPQAIYRRFAYKLEHTYPNRISPPASPQRASWPISAGAWVAS